MQIMPEEFNKRSFLCREVTKAGAIFKSINNSAIANTYSVYSGNMVTEVSQARDLGLCDISALTRTGYKGWNSSSWLETMGAKITKENNKICVQSDNSRVGRLGVNEFIVLGDYYGNESIVEKLNETWSMEKSDGCFKVPRADTNCWLVVTGKRAPEFFAKICAVDLRGSVLPSGSIVQTNVARLNAILIKSGNSETPIFDILVDTASAVYLWRALLDAMLEFDGKPIGLAAIHKIND